MVKRLIFGLFAFGLVGCLEGPAGKAGKDFAVHKESGILYASDLKEGHWDIIVGMVNLQNATVQVWVRSGSGYMWQPPTWYLSDSYVRIIDDSLVAPQWEYKIITTGTGMADL